VGNRLCNWYFKIKCGIWISNIGFGICNRKADIRNKASIRVLEKMGMHEKGSPQEHAANIIIMEVAKYNFTLM